MSVCTQKPLIFLGMISLTRKFILHLKETTTPQTKQDVYFYRVSQVVDEEMGNVEVFRERLHQTKIITHIVKLMKSNFSSEEFLVIEKEDLRSCVGQLMAKELIV
jgi:hypothetical protein